VYRRRGLKRRAIPSVVAPTVGALVAVLSVPTRLAILAVVVMLDGHFSTSPKAIAPFEYGICLVSTATTRLFGRLAFLITSQPRMV